MYLTDASLSSSLSFESEFLRLRSGFRDFFLNSIFFDDASSVDVALLSLMTSEKKKSVFINVRRNYYVSIRFVNKQKSQRICRLRVRWRCWVVSKNTEAYRRTVLMGRLKQNFPDS